MKKLSMDAPMKKSAIRMKETIGTDFMMSTKGESIWRTALDFEAIQLKTIANKMATSTLSMMRKAEMATERQWAPCVNSCIKVEATAIGPGSKNPVPPKEAVSCQIRRMRRTPKAEKMMSCLLFCTVVKVVGRHIAADGLGVHAR